VIGKPTWINPRTLNESNSLLSNPQSDKKPEIIGILNDDSAFISPKYQNENWDHYYSEQTSQNFL
jgi:hypothetical protein